MKQITKPSTILKWKGELVEVSSIAEGKTIFMCPLNAKPCECCGRIKEYSALENSPLFQECAEKIETLED